jgi:hypothetical protein
MMPPTYRRLRRSSAQRRPNNQIDNHLRPALLVLFLKEHQCGLGLATGPVGAELSSTSRQEVILRTSI